MKKKSIVYLEIYRKDMLLFVSDTTKAEVFLVGAFAYRYRMYVLVASVVVCFLVFVGCFLWGVRRRGLYIQDICQEIRIMEGGCLEHGGPVKGKDELAQLAAGLNQMRMTLKENLEKEQELRRANRDLIVGMAHDLRTPLTALTTYVEIIRSGVCTDKAKRASYGNIIADYILPERPESDSEYVF